MGERRDIVDIRKRTPESNNMPQHIAIIMDGNGRWAKKRLLPRTMGHREGMKAIKRIVKACVELNIQVLTVFAFSTENWRRPQNEVNYLMDLLIEFLNKELQELHENDIRINILGDYSYLPQKCVEGIEHALQITSQNQKLTFNLAINYGSRTEILQAVKRLGQEMIDGKINMDEITEDVFSSYLYTHTIPDPDLLIRTAGEMRVSNFLLWQIAYTELWITDVTWPEFNREHLMQAIKEYQKRDRRFGGLNQQQ